LLRFGCEVCACAPSAKSSPPPIAAVAELFKKTRREISVSSGRFSGVFMRWMGKGLRENFFDYSPEIAFEALGTGEFEPARIEAEGESDD
jgi:hypothetical protein